MNHFFTEPYNITEDTVIINGNDVRHIKNVLRMKAGDELLVSDGNGHDYHCVINSVDEKEISCRILSEEASGNESTVKFFLFQGLPKSDKLEHIIQKSVELGVYEIIPVQTARSIVKYDKNKLAAKLQRWNRISESAAKQSRRGIIPRVSDIMSFTQAMKYASELDLVLMPYENFKDMKATRAALNMIRPGMKVGILIGPEGGFEQDEVERAAKPVQEGGTGAVLISLGSRILRTETAPLMLLSVLMFAQEI